VIDEILKETEERMKKTVEFFRKELAGIRAGRATPALLDRIMVDYYGTQTPLNQLANVSAPEPRLLVIQPYDKTAIGEIEKAIMKSDLGITPNTDGNIIRLTIPQLTEERRQQLVKVVRKKAEEERVAIRNARRDANDQLKRLERDGEIPEDDARRAQAEVQELTDKYIKEIDELLAQKERDVMEV